jgi:hypothetical protein
VITKEHGILGLVGICLVVLLLSFAGLASDFVTRLIGSIDGLLLLAICLMMFGLFAGMLFAMGKEEGWIPSRRHAADAPSAKPGPKQPGEGK